MASSDYLGDGVADPASSRQSVGQDFDVPVDLLRRLRERGFQLPSELWMEPLPARLVRQDDDRLVLEIELPVDVDWKPKRAQLTLADGSVVSVEVDRRATTRKGKMRAGQLLRLVLKLAGPLSAPVRQVELEQKRRATLRLEVR